MAGQLHCPQCQTHFLFPSQLVRFSRKTRRCFRPHPLHNTTDNRSHVTKSQLDRAPARRNGKIRFNFAESTDLTVSQVRNGSHFLVGQRQQAQAACTLLFRRSSKLNSRTRFEFPTIASYRFVGQKSPFVKMEKPRPASKPSLSVIARRRSISRLETSSLQNAVNRR